MHNSTEFRIGNYRPIYLWAGPGTIRMNKVKFMQVAVDEKVHIDAHKPESAELVVNKLYQNWIHLTYSWGFPPEIEIEDWNSFEAATREYHKLGAKVFAYIQSSNCVYSGSFMQKDWYALTPQGKKIYYYSDRYMTCFQHQEWLDYLRERVADAINRGADGIFFDNMWYGLQPNSLYKTWLGGAGCYCPTCQAKYSDEMGKSIPVFTDLKRKEVLEYIDWRASKMTEVINQLTMYARSIKPDVVISANDYDPIMRPAKLIFGIDFPALARIQDITMIENFALPKWETQPERLLVNNAVTVRNTQPLLPPKKHLSVLSYDIGIGFDPVYPPHRILTGMAEAAALGCSMTTKGTEYHDGEKMTLLTAPEYTEQQQAIGNFHRWLEENQWIYQTQSERCAKIAILYPGDLLWQQWHKIAPVYFAVQQTFLVNGIPWKVITSMEKAKPDDQIIIFNEKEIHHAHNNKIINGMNLSLADTFSESFFERNPSLKRPLASISEQLIRGYHGNKVMRRFMDWLGMAKLITHTPFFKVPDVSFQQELLGKLNLESFFRVISQHPVLIDVWKTEQDKFHIHLVNYSSQKQPILLKSPLPQKYTLLSPDEIPQDLQARTDVQMEIDLYNILTTIEKENK